MRIYEVNQLQSTVSKVKKFADWAIGELKITGTPDINYGTDKKQVTGNRSFGSTNNNGEIWVHISNRNPADIMRTLCHELVHFKQFEDGEATVDMDDEQRLAVEDEANAIAGRMMRDYGKKHSDIYEAKSTKLRADVSAALPGAYIIPELPNSDFYKQYRFGVAMASAKGKKEREKEHLDTMTASSAWGESQVVIGYGDDNIEEYIDTALEEIGLSPRDKKLTTTKASTEAPGTPKQSPVNPFKGY